MTQKIEQRQARVRELESQLTKANERIAEPVDPALSAEIERTDWTPAEALQFYADQRNFDIVGGHARIIDNGAIASNALKHLSIDRLELKGDAELAELLEQLAAEQLNNKLLRDALNQWIYIASNCSIENGCCGCGESIENHSHPMICGHSPVDMADYVVRGAVDSTDKALSIPASTEALNELIEKVEKRTIDRCCVELKRFDYWYSTAAIIRLPTGKIKLEELL